MKACDLVVRIVYEPAKMSLMTSLSKKDMLVILRKELDAMKLPHPPELNVQPPTSEGLTFFWTTYADSPLHKTVTFILDGQEAENTKARKSEFSIDHISLWERAPSSTLIYGKNKYNHKKRTFDTMRPSTYTNDIEYGPQRPPHLLRTADSNKSTKAPSFSSNAAIQDTGDELSVRHARKSKPADTMSLFFPQAAKSRSPSEEADSRVAEEFWETRRQLNVAYRRAAELEKLLEDKGVFTAYDEPPAEEFPLLLAKAQEDLLRERKERITMEKVLDDVLRECASPVIVPELLRVLRDHHSSLDDEDGEIFE